MDDRSLRIAVLLSAHLIFLSAGALRILRGQRAHLLVADAPWWIQYYPPLVWLPFVVAYVQPFAIDLDQGVRLAGLAIAAASAAFAAWAMWSLGRSYGIRMDVFEGHSLKTDGPYALVRHPMYTSNVIMMVGIPLALGSYWGLVFVIPGLLVLALRIRDEEKLLQKELDGYREYTQKVRYRLVPCMW